MEREAFPKKPAGFAKEAPKSAGEVRAESVGASSAKVTRVQLLQEAMAEFELIDKHPKDDSVTEAEWASAKPDLPFERLLRQADGAANGNKARCRRLTTLTRTIAHQHHRTTFHLHELGGGHCHHSPVLPLEGFAVNCGRSTLSCSCAF